MKPMQNNATRAKPMAIPRTTCEEPEECSLEMTSSGLSVVVVFIVGRVCVVVVDVKVVKEVTMLVVVEDDVVDVVVTGETAGGGSTSLISVRQSATSSLVMCIKVQMILL